MIFLSPTMLLLLIALPAVAWFMLRGLSARLAACRVFGASGSYLPSRAAHWLPLAALGAIGIALARPAWQQEPDPVGFAQRDVLFLLDVSRSMLARDMAPDRLGAARQAILDCLSSLEGNRVGLVTFAGSPSSICPLTTDYAFFTRAVEEASPEQVAHGGTRIGDAIRKSVDKLLDPERAGLQDIILISDGGDQQSRPGEAAADLENLGVFLIAIGIGDDRIGSRIPAGTADAAPGKQANRDPTAAFTMHQGQEVWSRLEPGALRTVIREVEHGAYLHAGTRGFDLAKTYRQLVQHLQHQHPPGSVGSNRWREEFPWFIGLAALLLSIGPVGCLLSRRRQHPDHAAHPAIPALVLACWLGSGSLCCPSRSHAAEAPRPENPRTLFNEGVGLLERGEFRDAIERFDRTLAGLRGSSATLALQTIYNLGCARFALAENPSPAPDPAAEETTEPPPHADPLEEYLAAARAFRACLDLSPDHPDAAWNLELALLRADDCRMEEERQATEPPGDRTQQGPDETAADEPSESGDEEDGEGAGTTDDHDGEFSADQQGNQAAIDLLNRDLPPPAIDPQDLLMEEQRNNESRQKSRGANYRAVEKDW